MTKPAAARFKDAPAIAARLGLKVFPVRLIPLPNGKTNKVPAIGGAHGHLDATDDMARLVEWAKKYASGAVGVSCAANNIDVMDDDEHHPFTPTAKTPTHILLRDIEAKLHCPLDTLVHTSVSGGRQFWFQKTGLPMRGKRKGEAFDLKSNGFVVLTALPDDWRARLKPMPQPWVDFFAKSHHASPSGPSPLPPLRSLSPEDAECIRELLDPFWTLGQIHPLSLYLAGALAKAGVSQEDAEALLLSFPLFDDNSVPHRRQNIKTTYTAYQTGRDVKGMSGFEELGVEAETITALDALLFPEFTMWDDDTDDDSAGGSDGRAADHMPPFPDSAWRGLLADYLALVTPITEAPPAFHYASAVAVIVSVLGDYVKLYDEDPGLLNLYCLLLGSTATKKGTAMSYAVKLFLRRLTCLRTGDCWTIDDVSSGEALIRLLDPTHEPGHSQRLLLEDEAATLLTHTTQQGSTLESRLCSAYDQKPLARNVVKKGESIAVDDYVLSVLAGGTPVHLNSVGNARTMVGGLMNRFCIFYAEPTGRLIALRPRLDEAAATALVAKWETIVRRWFDLRDLPDGRQAVPDVIYVNYSSGARDLFTRWYEERYGAAAHEDELFQKLTHRAHLHVKKIAAVYALLENDPATAYASGELLCTDITADQMQAALEVVTYTLESARYLANTWTGPRSAQQETQQRLEQRVRLMLNKHGCMRKSALLRHLNNTSTDELNRALEALNGSELTYSDKARPQWVHARKCQCSKRAPAADSSEHKGEK